jgi:peptidoglycan/xylan/chitin deacetylase (PgdA/CDA1 family)
VIATALQRAVRRADHAIARAYLSCFRERSALVSFLFHGLFRDEREMARNLMDPLERTTVEQFGQLIEYYLSAGYRFVRPEDLLSGLEAGGRYALLTFDDGYYNNTRALPVLERYAVPALFFISTNHVRQNKCFWWDALYRELTARGLPEHRVHEEIVSVKAKRTADIEAELKARFGPDVLAPRGEIDRPFSPSELREFARHPRVHLGNHTADHAILTNYTPDEIRRQIRQAQEDLREMAGVEPTAIAYPNGAYNDAALAASREAGIQLGFTVRQHKARLPLSSDADALLRLGRFIPHADDPMPTQCRTYRSDVSLYAWFRDCYLTLTRRPGSPAR